MRVFIAVATSDQQYVKSLRSIFEMKKRAGDDLFFPDHFGQGMATRITLEDAFFNKKEYDAILLLDADQRHPWDMLEKLREPMEDIGLDMVCAHYYKRSTKPIESLCYELGADYPYQPMLYPPREGLHEIATTGFGCVLIHRRVIDAVRKTLPKGESPFMAGALPHVTGDNSEFGQDFRFFLLARQLGYKLWLRADVESLHGVTVWLGHDSAEKLFDGQAWADHQHEVFIEERIKRWGMGLEAFRQRQRILEARQEELKKNYDAVIAAFNKGETPELRGQMEQYSIALFELGGRLKEVGAWIEWEEKYPPITRPDQLPKNKPLSPDEPLGEVKQVREEMYRGLAEELIEMLPSREGASGHA